LAKRYLSNLAGIKGLILPEIANGASHVYHLFVVRTERRDELQSFLDSNGVKTVIHYPIPPHLQQAYNQSGFGKGDFPVAEKLSDTSLSLPLYPGLKDEQLDYVSDLLLKFFN
jgi:dTDP-4-amino-4,6-dideoxygalactose transaminase